MVEAALVESGGSLSSISANVVQTVVVSAVAQQR